MVGFTQRPREALVASSDLKISPRLRVSLTTITPISPAAPDFG
jgi:hypothetical protein